MKQSRPSYRDSYTWKCAECETINGIHRDFCRKCHVGIYESQAMNDTPRTDAEAFPDFENGGDVVLAEFARTIERELTAAKQEIERLDVSGIHSCHDNCQRHVCTLKRERDALAIARDQRNQLDKESPARLIFPWESTTIKP
jgi:hypothetical protein